MLQRARSLAISIDGRIPEPESVAFCSDIVPRLRNAQHDVRALSVPSLSPFEDLSFANMQYLRSDSASWQIAVNELGLVSLRIHDCRRVLGRPDRYLLPWKRLRYISLEYQWAPEAFYLLAESVCRSSSL